MCYWKSLRQFTQRPSTPRAQTSQRASPNSLTQYVPTLTPTRPTRHSILYPIVDTSPHCWNTSLLNVQPTSSLRQMTPLKLIEQPMLHGDYHLANAWPISEDTMRPSKPYEKQPSPTGPWPSTTQAPTPPTSPAPSITSLAARRRTGNRTTPCRPSTKPPTSTGPWPSTTQAPTPLTSPAPSTTSPSIWTATDNRTRPCRPPRKPPTSTGPWPSTTQPPTPLTSPAPSTTSLPIWTATDNRTRPCRPPKKQSPFAEN